MSPASARIQRAASFGLRVTEDTVQFGRAGARLARTIRLSFILETALFDAGVRLGREARRRQGPEALVSRAAHQCLEAQTYRLRIRSCTASRLRIPEEFVIDRKSGMYPPC